MRLRGEIDIANVEQPPPTAHDVGWSRVGISRMQHRVGLRCRHFDRLIGGGCTSGHGVCGIARLPPRSLVATATFMATGFATVYVMRHVIGG